MYLPFHCLEGWYRRMAEFKASLGNILMKPYLRKEWQKQVRMWARDRQPSPTPYLLLDSAQHPIKGLDQLQKQGAGHS